MSGGYDNRCEDCVPCPDCARVAYCRSEPNLAPCEHKGLCGDCALNGCQVCALEEMTANGAYSPDLDPFYRPENEATDQAHLEANRLTTFDPRSNSYRSQQ